MPSGTITDIKVAGIACAVPDNTIETSSYFGAFGETNVKKFTKMTGVKTRCVSVQQQTSSDLCFIAAKELLGKLKWKAESVEALIFVSQTPDYTFPATACVLQNRLNLSSNCIAFDVNLGCSGYVYGMFIIHSMMQSGKIKRALLLTGDTVTKVVSDQDRSSAMLFGDAGAATALEYEPLGSNKFEYLLKTDGIPYKSIIIPAGRFRTPAGIHERYEFDEGIIRSDYEIYLDGTAVFNFTISDVPESIHEFKAIFEVKDDDVDMYVLHQANLFMLKTIANKAGIAVDKLPITIDRYGNTSVASIPLTICDVCTDFGSNKELNLICSGFGVGLSWGVVSLKIDSKNCFPLIASNDFYADGGISRK